MDKLERCTDVSVCGIAIHKRLNCTTSLADAPQHCYSSVSIPLPPGQEKKDQIECAIVVFRHFLFYRPPAMDRWCSALFVWKALFGTWVGMVKYWKNWLSNIFSSFFLNCFNLHWYFPKWTILSVCTCYIMYCTPRCLYLA